MLRECILMEDHWLHCLNIARNEWFTEGNPQTSNVLRGFLGIRFIIIYNLKLVQILNYKDNYFSPKWQIVNWHFLQSWKSNIETKR